MRDFRFRIMRFERPVFMRVLDGKITLNDEDGRRIELSSVFGSVPLLEWELEDCANSTQALAVVRNSLMWKLATTEVTDLRPRKNQED